MRAHRAVDEELKQVGAQHVPVVVMVLVAVIAAHHQAADALACQQRLVDGEVSEVGFDGGAFLRVQRLARLQSVQRRRRITRIVGERIRRQAWWQVVAHASHITRAPLGARR